MPPQVVYNCFQLSTAALTAVGIDVFHPSVLFITGTEGAVLQYKILIIQETYKRGAG
jgi:hypothetical protein